MKITAEIIDHNIAALIDDLRLWETVDSPEIKTMSCGYIQGMIDLAKTLKEVLRA